MRVSHARGAAVNDDFDTVELDGVLHRVRPVTGSVSIGITRYFRAPAGEDVLGRLSETPFTDAEPVRIVKRTNARAYVVRRVPVREKAP